MVKSEEQTLQCRKLDFLTDGRSLWVQYVLARRHDIRPVFRHAGRPILLDDVPDGSLVSPEYRSWPVRLGVAIDDRCPTHGKVPLGRR